MSRNYAALYYEYLNEMDCLTDEEFGRLCRALLRYSKDGVEISLDGNERFYAKRVMSQEDRAVLLYESTKQARSDAGAKGASKRWQSMANDGKVWQNIANDGKPKQTMASDDKNAKSLSLSYNISLSNESESARARDNNIKKEGTKKFIPPTLEDVKAYCRERGNNVDPERWFAYYQSNGWRVGRNPMKDFKAAIRTWERNGYDRPAQTVPEREESFDADEFFQDALKKSYGGQDEKN